MGVRVRVRACVCVGKGVGVGGLSSQGGAGIKCRCTEERPVPQAECYSHLQHRVRRIFSFSLSLLESFPSQILDCHPLIGIHTFEKFDRNEVLGHRFYKLNKQSGITSCVGPGPVVTSLDVHVTSVKKSGETLVLFLTSAFSMISEQKNMTTGAIH